MLKTFSIIVVIAILNACSSSPFREISTSEGRLTVYGAILDACEGGQIYVDRENHLGGSNRQKQSFETCSSIAQDAGYNGKLRVAAKYSALACKAFMRATNKLWLDDSSLGYSCEYLWIGAQKSNLSSELTELASESATRYFETSLAENSDYKRPRDRSVQESLVRSASSAIEWKGYYNLDHTGPALGQYAYLAYRKSRNKKESDFYIVAIAGCEKHGIPSACSDLTAAGIKPNDQAFMASQARVQSEQREQARQLREEQREAQAYKQELEAQWGDTDASVRAAAVRAIGSIAATAEQSRAQVVAAKQGVILPPARTGDPIQDSLATGLQNLEATRQNIAMQEQRQQEDARNRQRDEQLALQRQQNDQRAARQREADQAQRDRERQRQDQLAMQQRQDEQRRQDDERRRQEQLQRDQQAAEQRSQPARDTREYHAGGLFSGCVQQYARNDEQRFKNGCGESVFIVYQDSPGSNGVSAETLAPGESGATGRSNIGQVVICRAGFVPVGADNIYWSGGQYRCRK